MCLGRRNRFKCFLYKERDNRETTCEYLVGESTLKGTGSFLPLPDWAVWFCASTDGGLWHQGGWLTLPCTAWLYVLAVLQSLTPGVLLKDCFSHDMLSADHRLLGLSP